MTVRGTFWGVLLLLFFGVSAWAQASETGTGGLPERKPLGKRFKVKVRSVGIPGHDGSVRYRTRYHLRTGQKAAGSGFLNEFVYLDMPGTYSVEVNGLVR